MADVINFPIKKLRIPQEVKTIKEVSDELDEVILAAIHNKGLHPHEVAGLLAHRLGSLLRPIQNKDKVFAVCSEVLKKQASIES